MTELLLLVGIGVAVFVGYNIGGATTGPAFAPAVGANVLTKTAAAAFMSIFFFVGAWTIGPRVVDTLGRDIMHDPSVFTLETSIGVLFFIGFALFVGNFFGVPSSTSMSAVGGIAGLGLATSQLNWAVIGEILAWWIVAPIIGFWISGVVGRYFYPTVNQWVAIERDSYRVIIFKRFGPLPYPTVAPEASQRELAGSLVVIGIGCLMAFSSGTSNIANAIAPLVGSGDLGMTPGIIIGSIAVAIGAFTIARRTMETLGNDITDLPLTAAIIVATISSTIVILLSAIGIPASFVVIATMSIIGLGWGRASRTTTMGEIQNSEPTQVSVGALAGDQEGEALPEMGEETAADIPDASDLFDPATAGRVILLQNVVPIIATVGAYLSFRFLPIWGL